MSTNHLQRLISQIGDAYRALSVSLSQADGGLRRDRAPLAAIGAAAQISRAESRLAACRAQLAALVAAYEAAQAAAPAVRPYGDAQTYLDTERAIGALADGLASADLARRHLRDASDALHAPRTDWALRVRAHVAAHWDGDRLDVRGLRRALQSARLMHSSARDASILVYGANTARRRSLTLGSSTCVVLRALDILGIPTTPKGGVITWCGAYPMTRRAAVTADVTVAAVHRDIANLVAFGQ